MKMRDTAARMSVVSLVEQNKERSDDTHTTGLETSKPRHRNLRESRREFDDRLARLSRRFDPGRF
jgi:hypothetical protein